MRLFLAVTLPDDVRERMARATEAARRAVPGVRWVDAGRLHLTVKFLGERPDDAPPALERALRPALASTPPIAATIRGAGAFPNFRRPRVVWLGMHPLAPLADIARRVDDALTPLGIERERRPFRAHVTLGRVNDGFPAAQGEALERALRAVGDAWSLCIADLALMRSTLGRGGPAYDVLARIPLGSSGAS